MRSPEQNQQNAAVNPANAPSISFGGQDPERQAYFEKLAPEGWHLKSFGEGGAEYRVSIPPGNEQSSLSAMIRVDGANERMVSMGTAIIRNGAATEEEWSRAQLKYRDYDGYKKTVSVESFGYYVKYRQEIHSVSYVNRDIGVSCWGKSPGQLSCYWGSKEKRYSIYFQSDDIDLILPYVLKIAKGF
jgi:hypothetical protein